MKKTTQKMFMLACLTLLVSFNLQAKNNTITSFSKAKKLLENKVYFDHRKTLYCDATFDSGKRVMSAIGFTTTKYKKRSKKVEWEHLVPAENFGRFFTSWREGHLNCVDSKGKRFKGRNCASKVDLEFRKMAADLYNLAPAIGGVNALRKNYKFSLLPNAQSDFGACQMKIEDSIAEPPARSRGRIARAYLYFDETYSQFNLSKQQSKLMHTWNREYPVSDWECLRAQRIKNIQGNRNAIVENLCSEK